MRGAQLAVGGNITACDFQGWQAAYLLNLVGGTVRSRGVQIAVGGNIAGNLEGTQLSIGNIALGLRQDVNIPGAGTQIGIVNFAYGGIGTQIGALNIAGHVETSQIGLLNVAGRMSGIPIGLINFVKDNPLHLQFWGSDTEVTNLGIRIGSRHAYSLLMVGGYPHGDSGRWSLGFGLGGHIPITKQLFLNVDLITRGVVYTDELSGMLSDDDPNALNKLRLAVGWEKDKWFSVFGGISLNTFITRRLDTSDFGYGFGRVYRRDDIITRVWPGFFAGVQF